MITSLLTCTLLYVGVAIVLTLMIPFAEINVDAPLSYAFVVKQVSVSVCVRKRRRKRHSPGVRCIGRKSSSV